MLAHRAHTLADMIDSDVLVVEVVTRLIKRGKESGRPDDNAETIRKRLDVYRHQTSPLVEWYEREGLHHHVVGVGSLESIFAQIEKIIG